MAALADPAYGRRALEVAAQLEAAPDGVTTTVEKITLTASTRATAAGA